jgi:4-hydroxy-2-oxoheptanedioate aldolase
MSNSFKQGLMSGTPQIGIWHSLASPYVADALSRLGYDWLLCDTEHAPLEVSGALPVLQAADHRTHVVVRAAWNDKVLIKRHLDQGAQTLLIPFVENAEEASAAVAATRYPPAGIRGVAGGTRASAFGTEPNYLKNANDGLCVIVQLETSAALEQLPQIAAVDGVDGIFIGPSDLAASMGHLGAPGHVVVQEAIRNALNQLKDLGIPAGILATTDEDANRYLDWGFDFVAVGVDLGLLVGAAKARLANTRR